MKMTAEHQRLQDHLDRNVNYELLDTGILDDQRYFDVIVEYAKADAVNPANEGTKAAAWYRCQVPSQGSCMLRLRLSVTALAAPFDDFETLVDQREAEVFYSAIQRANVRPDQREIQLHQ